MSEVKPREFVIYNGERGLQVTEKLDAYTDRPIRVHVIEKSAYQKAITALKSICGNRCAHQNPCEAREALIYLGEM